MFIIIVRYANGREKREVWFEYRQICGCEKPSNLRFDLDDNNNATTRTAHTMDQFLLFGDSITQQSSLTFSAALSDAYIRRLDVINRGLSGYNTRQALRILPHAVPPPQVAKIRFMTVFFGANDARLPHTPGGPQQHVPLSEYRENLKAIITHPRILEHDGARLILITPPPVDERMCLESSKAEDPDFPDVFTRPAATTAQYASVVRQLGQEYNLPVVDIWSTLILRAGGMTGGVGLPIGSSELAPNPTFQSFFRDGLHLSSLGYEVLYEELMSVIENIWPEQMPSNLPFVLPGWQDQEAWLPYR
ncbi:related to GDSL Lipase/Acylhydrolase family protein [Ramularia collo-cygni]|uniref:Related to GDSL Lipase/Acylhydrolase family protein n=1 Tax=Ramularia collo-cygni TaxID=112498 RepID=A0A2D3UQF7_9PEZI|nr:related to GDSL Lipase/Acylhydrolase family protein [Ramularia collo-cygni]CZT15445.1 related to GDSL Lipase/Acylhydrolase family protein [Ramularia collo-cygni]